MSADQFDWLFEPLKFAGGSIFNNYHNDFITSYYYYSVYYTLF